MEFLAPHKDPRTEWHQWFAWRPVRLKPGDGSAQPVVWLEWIERRIEWEDSWGDTFRNTFYRKPSP